ncbi:MAG: hypothetical protein K2M06_04745 [Muribaculaceae bacterium]|nr:hypothetical protein [Muribaculaceae bacterium]
MKKTLICGLLTLAMICGFSSCSDDNDLPDVSFVVNFDDATEVDGVLYVVQGETFDIESITPINNESNKAVELGGATYYWDYRPIGASLYKPFAFEITVTPATSLGRHILEIYCPVYAVDKAPANAIMSYQVEVVASADDLPVGGNTSVPTTAQVSKTDN